MLGLFISNDGEFSIIEGREFALAPELAACPHRGDDVYRLIAMDAVVLGGRAEVVAVYEQKLPSPWQMAVRPGPEQVRDAAGTRNGDDHKRDTDGS